jgi:hypothetical protein
MKRQGNMSDCPKIYPTLALAEITEAAAPDRKVCNLVAGVR